MITTFTIYRADGRVTKGIVDWPPDPSLEQIKELVDPLVGGDCEHVSVLDPKKAAAEHVERSDYRDLFVEDQGHAHAKRYNEKATVIYRANWLRTHARAVPEELPWIAGDAVLFDRVVWR